ncbi:MAG: MFS transporter, partial [archaeon]|nr:MFS transporter [archaeon]
MENYNKNNINNTIINETSSQKQKKYEQNGKNNHSSMEIFSYSLMGSGASIIISIVVNWFTLYYETIIKLDPTLMIFAYLVYTVWDAINDPIVGYLSDKPNRFTRKYGKRFPWTISFSIPCLIFFILLFLPPDPIINEWLTFFWFLGIYCLWDTAYTIVTVNNQALLPSKYRSDSDRRKISAYTQILALLVYGTAATLPPILITAFGEGKDAYSK